MELTYSYMDNHLDYRANVMEIQYRDKITNECKYVFIYDDHRWILNVLNSIKNYILTSDKDWIAHNIIYFDSHDDAVNQGRIDLRKIKKYLNSKLPIREFYEMVEFDINLNDDDWVTIGMELELIKDVVCIGSQSENKHIQEWKNNTYITKLKKAHKGFCINHLSSELSNDAIYNNNEVGNILGIKKQNTALAPNYPYVLDFDLDCFTTNRKNKTVAWSKKKFTNEFVNNNDVRCFMQKLISNASAITICREPMYCGGIKESNKILDYLDEFLFDGVLERYY